MVTAQAGAFLKTHEDEGGEELVEEESWFHHLELPLHQISKNIEDLRTQVRILPVTFQTVETLLENPLSNQRLIVSYFRDFRVEVLHCAQFCEQFSDGVAKIQVIEHVVDDLLVGGEEVDDGRGLDSEPEYSNAGDVVGKGCG